MRNNRFHKSLKKTPYEALFGHKPHSLPSIISIEDEQMEDEDYKLGTESGVLPHRFVRSGFTVAKSDHLGLSDVPTCSISLRSAAKASSQQEGQGFKHCNCNSGCEGNRCSCKKEGKMCNNRCHKSLSCSNK
uniref:CXC domain-containing protein n=1 Tax=Meloidogyne hapla TaxID=6305 RepID=A0A1I8B373_MELHA